MCSTVVCEVHRSGAYEITKRLLDISISLAALTLSLPLLALIAALVKLTSPGPVLFAHKRLGLHGKPFRCLKFRTMVPDAEDLLANSPSLQAQFHDSFKIENDPRVTRIGRFLRKSSLDELPQFFNILLGTMSLIGPRPIVPHERQKFGEHAAKILSVKPGLGGAWQAYGRCQMKYADRIRWNLWYVDRRSTLLDLKLMALTAWNALRGHGAC